MLKYLFILFSIFALILPFAEEVEAARIYKKSKSKKTFSKYYGGLGMGASGVGLLRGTETEGVYSRTFSIDSDSALAWKAFMGMRYNKYMNLEIAYQNFGEFEQDLELVNNDTQVIATSNTELSFKGLSLEMRPKYRLGRYFVAQGLVGLSYNEVSRTSSGKVSTFVSDANQDFISSSDSEVGLIYGLALEYILIKKWAARFELNFTEHGDEKFNLREISIYRNFNHIPLPFLKK